MNTNTNPFVFTCWDLLFQRLSDYVIHGYTHVTCGQIPASNAQALARKFDMNYQIFADKNLRARRKRNHLGNAKWVTYIKNDVVYWWLMVTPQTVGEHFAHKAETLVDVTQVKTAIRFEQFELVQLPYSKPTKPKKPNYKERTKPTRWTWRFTAECYENIRHGIIDAVRSRNINNLANIVSEIYFNPSAGEIRSQVGKLSALYKNEVKRAQIANAPKTPEKLPFKDRLPDTGIRLSSLSRKQKKEDVVVNHV